MNDKMKRSDYIAKDVLDLFEKYDLYWQPFYHERFSFNEDPWNQSEHNDLYYNINENKDLVRNALLEVIDKNRDFFDKYVCPYRRLLDIIYKYTGLSDYGKDLIEELYEKCRSVERERKLWIHDFILRTVPQPGLNTSIETLKKYRNAEVLELDYDKSQMKIFMKKLREEYYNKFNKFKNFDETSVLTKELIRYAEGNTKYYFDPVPEHMMDEPEGLFEDENLDILLLAEKPEDAKEYVKQKDDEYIEEEEKEIEDLEIMSSAFSNNTTKKRGFLSRIFG